MSNDIFASLVGLEYGRQASLSDGRTQGIGTWNRKDESVSLTATKGPQNSASVLCRLEDSWQPTSVSAKSWQAVASC